MNFMIGIKKFATHSLVHPIILHPFFSSQQVTNKYALHHRCVIQHSHLKFQSSTSHSLVIRTSSHRKFFLILGSFQSFVATSPGQSILYLLFAHIKS
jgi:hypothetical protein